jgi:hypothetical protein
MVVSCMDRLQPVVFIGNKKSFLSPGFLYDEIGCSNAASRAE